MLARRETEGYRLLRQGNFDDNSRKNELPPWLEPPLN